MPLVGSTVWAVRRPFMLPGPSLTDGSQAHFLIPHRGMPLSPEGLQCAPQVRTQALGQAPRPPEGGDPVEGHAAQGEDLAGVVVVPGQPEAVTGEVEVPNVLITRNGQLVGLESVLYSN